MQQSAFEHAALIWTRPANTIRARGTRDAASEAGHMSAPDDAPESASKSLLRKGRLHMLHKSAGGRSFPFPGQTYPTASVTCMPSACSGTRPNRNIAGDHLTRTYTTRTDIIGRRLLRAPP